MNIIYLLFIILIIFSTTFVKSKQFIDMSDDDNLVLTRLRRQVKKFTYASPCELDCVTKKLHTKQSIKVLAVSTFLSLLYLTGYFLYRKYAIINAKINVLNRLFIINHIHILLVVDQMIKTPNINCLLLRSNIFF
jgi:hypothetical protein